MIWKTLIVWFVLATAAWCVPTAQELNTWNLEGLRRLAIQQGGRCKPLDTFAREAVRLITGKETFEKADPVASVLSWWAGGEQTLDLKVVECRNLQLKQQLGLSADQRWFSARELRGNAELTKLREELMKLGPQEKVPPSLTAAQELLSKLKYLEMVAGGEAWTVVPSPNKIEETWAAFTDLGDLAMLQPAREKVETLRKVVRDGKATAFASSVAGVAQELRKIGPYPDEAALEREVLFNHFHPFRKAWMLYTVALVCLLFAPVPQGSLYWVGVAAASFGFSLHAYGFFLRCMIAGRPPVTNMYESVLWVAFGAVLFSLAFEWRYRTRNYLLASMAGAVVCLVLADSLPAVLDPSIRPLTPVLRSNFWLTIHVLTITLGYAAFLLALGLGHMILWKHLLGPDQKEEIRGLNTALYKALQIGVLLLAAGTILGGVWANYSWGRFWGWDPKEVWALIALLGYLAILHGRYAGWLGNFGTAAASVVAFQGVLMAWYGVNFVLGAGLHSYGFGNGGVQYVACFTLAEIVFVCAVIAVRQKRLKGK